MQALSLVSYINGTRVMVGSAQVCTDNQLLIESWLPFSEWPFVKGDIKIAFRSIRYLFKDLMILQLQCQCAQVCNSVFTIEHSQDLCLP